MDKAVGCKRIYWLVFLIIVILAIFLGLIFFIKEGKKIATTPALYIELYEEDGKLFFTDTKKEDIVYLYNLENGKIEKNKRDNFIAETENYKYILNENGLMSLNKNTGEEYAILDLEKAKKEDGYSEKYGVQSFSVSNVEANGETIYFTYSEYVKSDNAKYHFSEKRLCKYTPSDKNLELVDTAAQVQQFAFFDNNIYYIGIQDNEEVISKIDTLTNEETVLINYNCDDYDYIAINNLKLFEKGIYYFLNYSTKDGVHNELCWYEFESAKFNYASMPDAIYTCDFNNEQDAFYVVASDELYSLYRVDIKLCGVEKICDDLLSLENVKNAVLTNIISIDDKTYYGVQSGWLGDDSYRIYSLDNNSKIEIIKKEAKHFLRNFFKSDFK